MPRPTPGRSLRSIIPKNKRKLGFYRADCQSGLFSSRAFPPRKVPPVEYLRNLKFFHCATPSGRLRIHPYFGAAMVLGGVCSPCLSATRSTHHPLLKAKAGQQGTSDRCFTMQQFPAHRSGRDNRRRAPPGCRARHARWPTRHRRELEVSALITRRVAFRMRAETSRNLFGHNTRI